MGSSCNHGGRPSKAVLLGANACSPALESLLLEALVTARACEMGSHHFRDARGMAISWAPGEGYWGILSRKPSVPCCLCWHTCHIPGLPSYYIRLGVLITVLAHGMTGCSWDSRKGRVQPVAKEAFQSLILYWSNVSKERQGCAKVTQLVSHMV